MFAWQTDYLKKIHNKVPKKLNDFFIFLFSNTDVTSEEMVEIMHGANVEINDAGRFYKFMCHDILESERNRKHDCQKLNKNVYDQYYASAKYKKGSSHKSFQDDNYPQYRMGKGSLFDFKTSAVSNIYDFIIGLRMKIINDKISIFTWFQFEYARGCCKIKSDEDLNKLDNISTSEINWNMSTKGHTWSTIMYVLTQKNQGPFGSSKKKDADPIKLKLEINRIHTNFSEITNKDSVNSKCKKNNYTKLII